MNGDKLYYSNKLEKLGTVTIMESRNPTIVRILEDKSSVIENRYSGIPTMKREMAKYNLPEPEFYEERGSFKVIFRNSNISEHQVDQYREKLLLFCKTPKTSKEIREFLNI